MKVTKAQAAQNRQDILEAAARLYREHGLDGVGVAEVTRGAGLTHGGLYRHFESKDALVREACARAFDWTITPLASRTCAGPRSSTGFAASGPTRSRSTRAASRHALPARLRRDWPSWPRAWSAPAMRRRRWRSF